MPEYLNIQVAGVALIFEVQRSARSEARKEEARRQELEVCAILSLLNCTESLCLYPFSTYALKYSSFCNQRNSALCSEELVQGCGYLIYNVFMNYHELNDVSDLIRFVFGNSHIISKTLVVKEICSVI